MSELGAWPSGGGGGVVSPSLVHGQVEAVEEAWCQGLVHGQVEAVEEWCQSLVHGQVEAVEEWCHSSTWPCLVHGQVEAVEEWCQGLVHGQVEAVEEWCHQAWCMAKWRGWRSGVSLQLGAWPSGGGGGVVSPSLVHGQVDLAVHQALTPLLHRLHLAMHQALTPFLDRLHLAMSPSLVHGQVEAVEEWCHRLGAWPSGGGGGVVSPSLVHWPSGGGGGVVSELGAWPSAPSGDRSGPPPPPLGACTKPWRRWTASSGVTKLGAWPSGGGGGALVSGLGAWPSSDTTGGPDLAMSEL